MVKPWLRLLNPAWLLPPLLLVPPFTIQAVGAGKQEVPVPGGRSEASAFKGTQVVFTSDALVFVDARLSLHGSGMSALGGLGIQNGADAVEDG